MAAWRKTTAVKLALLPLLLVTSIASALPQDHLATPYAQARNVRTRLGHEAAMPLYQELLENNPSDVTAATWIAACPETPLRHDKACSFLPEKITQLRKLLREKNYDNAHIQALFHVPSHLSFAPGPVYLTPATAGSTPSTQLSKDSKECALQCLVSLFLLGLYVRISVLRECLGHDSVQLVQDLGLCFASEELLVPYVHLFPLNVAGSDEDLILATDLHPRVLLSTTVGTNHDGAVMYIGPDSIALVQHLPTSSVRGGRCILDLCTGSGVQALAALKMLDDSKSQALCVDINERAVRFVRFNAILNRLESQVHVQQADLITGTRLGEPSSSQQSLGEGLRESCREMGCSDAVFHVILANPPFIPVPSDNDTILQRYGLFSSGGPDGEDVLKAIIQLASELLPSSGGLLGVVSEFMNPPTTKRYESSLLRRIQTWWGNGPGGRGILFTNEFPVDAETYATRRADTPDERDIWLRHLSCLQVSHVSPGLLFMFTDDSQSMSLTHEFVPKSTSGSIWTPSNRDAVSFTRTILQEML